MTSSRQFPCQPEAVAAARRFVRDALSDQPAELVATAELMTSELTTNCVLHARTPFELAVDAGREIRVEVRDMGEGRPMLRNPTALDAAGRGLQIVEAMSGDWGVILAEHGKTVWFALSDHGNHNHHNPTEAVQR